MKLIYTLALLTLTTLSAPALADSAWDSPAQGTSSVSADQSAADYQALNAANQQEQQMAFAALPKNNDGGLQWDTSAINTATKMPA